ncbi:MAG: hypothetical protein ACU0CF_04630 [Sagittula sp.]|uniref:hypothetical protein n=1 Tax=Sagittula sp. TaxID=2038081 RepID=UPI0040592624
MKLIQPITVTNSVLASSNVTEDDYPEWSAGTTYASGDFVIVTGTTHKVYQSAIGSNLGNNPVTDDGANWVEISATNRWKAFDQRLADRVQNSGSITYSLTAPSLVTGIAFFNAAAPSVRVQVTGTDSPGNEVFDEKQSLVDDTEIVDWFTFFTTDISGFVTEVLFTGMAAYPGYTIDITIGDGSGTAYVGQIVMGKALTLGETLEGTTIGLTSFSTKEVDSFGSWTIVPRAKSDPVNYDFAMPASAAGRVKRILNSLRDTPAVYFADESLVSSLGAMTYGFFQDYEIPLRKNGVSIVQLEIEGLT